MRSMNVSAASGLEMPYLHRVLGQSRARLQRSAVLGQALQVAVWSNCDDEVRYGRQGHHTLSVYLAGGQGSQLKGRTDAWGAAGRFCIFPAGHESHWLVREPVQFVHLYVSDIAWAERVVRLLDAEPRSHTLAPRIYAEDALYHRWAQSLRQLDWHCTNDLLRADLLCQQVLDTLVLQAATPQARQALQKPAGGLSSAARRRVLEYVDAHLADSKALGLAALAQVASLSEYHFARMFRLSMGCSVHAWVLARRLERARQMLAARGRAPALAQVAQDCGFSSASHLVRAFRAHSGATPTQFARWRHNA